MHVHVYIYVKPPDEYPWQGRNSFNSRIFVILKKLWTLNYRSPLLISQFLPALKWLLKSSLTEFYHHHIFLRYVILMKREFKQWRSSISTKWTITPHCMDLFFFLNIWSHTFMFPFSPTKVFLTHNHIIPDKKIIYKNKYKSSKNFISIKNKK